MKPDFLDDEDPKDYVNEPDPLRPIPGFNRKYCMLFLLKGNDRCDKLFKWFLEAFWWIDETQIFNRTNNIFEVYFDDFNKHNIDVDIYTIANYLCKKRSSLILYLANNQNNELQVFYEIRFYNNDFKDSNYKNVFKDSGYYKVMKLCEALHYGNANSTLYIENGSLNINVYKKLNTCAKEIDIYSRKWLEDFVAFNYPILLKEKNDMPTYEKMWDIERQRIERYLPPEEKTVLGYYTRKDEDVIEGPHIVLCPESIEEEACQSKGNYDSLFLYRAVLTHEFAHALMDQYKMYTFKNENNELKEERNKTSVNWPSKNMYAIAMEESLANMILLEMMENEPDDFNKTKAFIENQPLFYQFGWRQYNAHVDWSKWRNSSKDTSNLKLKDWFDKCFAGGEISIAEQDYSRELFDEVFI